jgi:hypothetical protein
LTSRVRVEYDRGKFRQATLAPNGKIGWVRVYDRNPQRICFMYLPGEKGKRAALDLDSYMYRLALSSPASYLKFNGMGSTGTINVNAPACSNLKQVDAPILRSMRKSGSESIDGKLSDVYEIGKQESIERRIIYNGWILGEDIPSRGHRVRIVSLNFHKNLAPSTFRLPKGYTIDAPRFARVNPPPGTTLHLIKSQFDVPSSGNGKNKAVNR